MPNTPIATNPPIAAREPARKPYDTAQRPAFATVFGLSGLVALLYTACFHGIDPAPGLSFTLFCPAALAALAFAMRRLGYLRNGRALAYAAPVTLLSILNGLFAGASYAFMNIFVMHGLFAAFTLRAMGLSRDALFTLPGLGRLCRVVLGDWLAACRAALCRMGERQATRRFAGLGKYILGALFALPFLAVIGFLLMWADRVFERLTEDTLIRLATALRHVDFALAPTFLLAFVYFAGYIWCAARANERVIKPFTPMAADARSVSVFLTLINALFLAFAVVQTAFLFTGGLLDLPGGLTYAQYAREGFFQLLAVTAINFGVIYGLLTLFRHIEASRAVRGLMFALLGFTLLLVASSGYRMFMYISVYGFTPLRLSVLTFLLMEAVLCAITANRLMKPQAPFTRRFITVGLAFYLLANATGSARAADGLNAALGFVEALSGWAR